MATVRPYGSADLGRRIRVVWRGSEYRGRGRETTWDGQATLKGNGFQQVRAVNRHSPDKCFELISPTRLRWASLTTGGFAGFDAWLDDGNNGILTLDAELVQATLAVADIGYEDTVFEAGGLGRRIRVFRLPDHNPHRRFVLEREVELGDTGDNALYLCITQEDGHLIWSSPMYIFK